MSASIQPAPATQRREKGANLVFLNIAKLDALKARAGEHRTEFWDRGLRGFGVRVYSSGQKIFTVRYWLYSKQRRKELGVYRNKRGVVGGEVTFMDARAEAERIISEARNDRDPFLSSALLKKADVTRLDREIREMEEGRRRGLQGPVLHTWLDKLLAERRERLQQLAHVRQRLQQAYVYLDNLLRGLTTMPEAEGPSREDRQRAQREMNV